MAGPDAYSGPFVIIAEFEVKPDKLEQFLELARTDASQSVAWEPGCQQFDLTLDREQPNRVVLYEVYEDGGGVRCPSRNAAPRGLPRRRR